VHISWMYANLIQVAQECRDTGGPTYPYHGDVGRNTYFLNQKGKKETRDGSSFSDLCHSCRVALHHWLVGIPLSKK
jgi:hypothetical protein